MKHIIIPVGDRAGQCKESIMQKLPSSYSYEWMEKDDFIKKYLYCAEDGDYESNIEVWIFAWDTPSNMMTLLSAPDGRHSFSTTELKIDGIGINLYWCKMFHKNIKRHLIYILPLRRNS